MGDIAENAENDKDALFHSYMKNIYEMKYDIPISILISSSHRISSRSKLFDYNLTSRISLIENVHILVAVKVNIASCL